MDLCIGPHQTYIFFKYVIIGMCFKIDHFLPEAQRPAPTGPSWQTPPCRTPPSSARSLAEPSKSRCRWRNVTPFASPPLLLPVCVKIQQNVLMEGIICLVYFICLTLFSCIYILIYLLSTFF